MQSKKRVQEQDSRQLNWSQEKCLQFSSDLSLSLEKDN